MLAELGHSLTGIELDPGLLALSRAELEGRIDLADRMKLLSGDMRDFELGQRFDRVIIPYSGLYCLLSASEVDACLRAAFRHLAPGGALCLDAYYADGFHADSEPEDVSEDQLDPIVSVVHEERVLRVYERSEWNKSAQRIDVHYEYRDDEGSLIHSSVVRQRYLLRNQLLDCLASAGFSECRTFADFADRAPVPETETIAVVASCPQQS